VTDWQTEYDAVKRNGGLIFGTPGILSLQYVVAVFATLASSVVFLSLILGRRKRELAILQSIGASVSQLSRLVIFEVISVFAFCLLLGGMLGVALAKVFTGLFTLFGGGFQLVLGTQVVILRELVWPWSQVLIVNGLIFVLVFLALFITTFRAIRSDLPTVLKEE
jgi:ABC-type lipoprotein release transport system permease subunit